MNYRLDPRADRLAIIRQKLQRRGDPARRRRREDAVVRAVVIAGFIFGICQGIYALTRVLR